MKKEIDSVYTQRNDMPKLKVSITVLFTYTGRDIRLKTILSFCWRIHKFNSGKQTVGKRNVVIR